MNYRIEKMDAFQIICKRKKVEKPENETAAKDICDFWAECTEDGTLKNICDYFPRITARFSEMK